MASSFTFQECRLLDGTEYGMSVAPQFKTSIIRAGNGKEQRNAEWGALPLRSYQVTVFAEGDTELHNLIAGFLVTFGMAGAFRFKDHIDFEGMDEPIENGGGSSFQLRKAYTFGGETVYRIITKPVAGTVVVKKNGVEVSPTIDYTTGIITLGGVGGGDVLTASFEFDVPVRFDSDQAPFNAVNFNSWRLGSLRLLEVRP